VRYFRWRKRCGASSFKARRIAVISPYSEEVDRAEHAYLTACGFEISSGECFGIRNSFELADVPVDRIIDAGKRAASLADAIFLSCMNMKSHLAVHELEQSTGLPVVSATTATAWALPGLSGIEPEHRVLGTLAANSYSRAKVAE
jgi:maleate isomerase